MRRVLSDESLKTLLISTHVSGKYRVIHLTANLPGPMAAARLAQAGISVTKIEPIGGDPLEQYDSDWYRDLHRDQQVIKMDLKNDAERERLLDLLKDAHLWFTSLRPSSLKKLRLDEDRLRLRFPKLAIITLQGYPAPLEDLPAHDLTCQASAGLISPPHLPKALIADFAAAERVFSTSLLALLRGENSGSGSSERIALSEMAEEFSLPWKKGITGPTGVLGGAHPGYDLYQAKDGWIALAALEPHFLQRFVTKLGLSKPDKAEFQKTFLTRTQADWERFAADHDIPLVKVETKPR